MLHTLNVTIEQTHINDKDAKLVALLILGLDYSEVRDCIDMAPNTARNRAHHLYDLFCIHHLQPLLRKAYASGFDLYGNYKNTPVLTPAEIERVKEKHPDIFDEGTMPKLVWA